MENTIQKICPVCEREFPAHPYATYCGPNCAQRAKRYRRKARAIFHPLPTPPPLVHPNTSLGQYERWLKNPTPDQLTAAYQDISRYNYVREFRIEPIPLPDVPKPSDVVVEYMDDHAIAFHASRSGMP